jgi:hypothetical protein
VLFETLADLMDSGEKPNRLSAASLGTVAASAARAKKKEAKERRRAVAAESWEEGGALRRGASSTASTADSEEEQPSPPTKKSRTEVRKAGELFKVGDSVLLLHDPCAAGDGGGAAAGSGGASSSGEHAGGASALSLRALALCYGMETAGMIKAAAEDLPVFVKTGDRADGLGDDVRAVERMRHDLLLRARRTEGVNGLLYTLGLHALYHDASDTLRESDFCGDERARFPLLPTVHHSVLAKPVLPRYCIDNAEARKQRFQLDLALRRFESMRTRWRAKSAWAASAVFPSKASRLRRVGWMMSCAVGRRCTSADLANSRSSVKLATLRWRMCVLLAAKRCLSARQRAPAAHPSTRRSGFCFCAGFFSTGLQRPVPVGFCSGDRQRPNSMPFHFQVAFPPPIPPTCAKNSYLFKMTFRFVSVRALKERGFCVRALSVVWLSY